MRKHRRSKKRASRARARPLAWCACRSRRKVETDDSSAGRHDRRRRPRARRRARRRARPPPLAGARQEICAVAPQPRRDLAARRVAAPQRAARGVAAQPPRVRGSGWARRAAARPARAPRRRRAWRGARRAAAARCARFTVHDTRSFLAALPALEAAIAAAGRKASTGRARGSSAPCSIRIAPADGDADGVLDMGVGVMGATCRPARRLARGGRLHTVRGCASSRPAAATVRRLGGAGAARSCSSAVPAPAACRSAPRPRRRQRRRRRRDRGRRRRAPLWAQGVVGRRRRRRRDAGGGRRDASRVGGGGRAQRRVAPPSRAGAGAALA